ncbi:helix-turn-helix protein [Kribbella steppae]|uniref:Helix-turn-helix protein n=1 Tax=Kribbella steppae TaxID=2512223 RepID=A0A4R2HGD1_9ACTN|nr:helix-turn-helix domain-containing protein [Kribbella steppae]TCO28233.1 helix-turn-helix protein [Kribbella steppae]
MLKAVAEPVRTRTAYWNDVVADGPRRRDLLDPALADRPVAAIGVRWGLTNPAHFNRAFKGAYGLPPAEFRAAYSALGVNSPAR